MVGTEDRYAAGFGDFTVARQRVLTLRFRSLGERLAQSVGASRVVAVRYAGDVILGFHFSIGQTLIVSWRTYGKDWPCLDWNCTQIRRAGSSSADLPKRTGDVEGKGNPRRSTF